MSEELSVVREPARAYSPSLRDLAAVMFRQRRSVLVTFFGVLLIVLTYAIFSPSYEAHMKILVRKGRVDPAVAPTPTQTLQLASPEVSEEELNSEVELLRDEELLRATVTHSGISNGGQEWLPWRRNDSEEMKTERAVQQLARHLHVAPMKKTTLIAVTYAASDPAAAANVLKYLASAYLAKHQQLRRPAGESDFFERQVSESRIGLQLAERQLLDFSRSQGVVSAAMQRDLALRQLSEAEGEQSQAEVGLAEAAQRIASLESKLNGLPETTTAQVRSAENQQLSEKLKSRLLELQLKRTELATKFRPSYRLVREVDEEIAQAQAAIQAERLAPATERTVEKNPDHVWTQAELLKAQVEWSGLAARARSSERLVAKYQSEAQQLGMRSITQDELLRNLKAAEDQYLLYAGKREEARIGDALDERGILNVALAEQPIAPALPSRSDFKIALAGLVAAVVCGTGAGFAADYVDPCFRTPGEVVLYLGVPVLASLPRGEKSA
jgi:uncharacterized protein involved in exopolysaccharide biosynthesis